MPTPDSGSTGGGSGSKRRRTGTYSAAPGAIYQDEPEEEEDDVDEDEEEEPDEATPASVEEEEQGVLRFYNPNQDPDQRRRVRATMRDHTRYVDGAYWLRGFDLLGSTNDATRKPRSDDTTKQFVAGCSQEAGQHFRQSAPDRRCCAGF
jgi:hypothetical protein